ncbi:MAG: glycine/sarcosine/betaine reductase component B subunit [Thermovenabulum sp.]|uniref:glycine/sarcosine/betaine reductase component B subunit n=1 Tax=Thermovenabulum sp. TaxID=3100335 RepID=UPI003C7B3573
MKLELGYFYVKDVVLGDRTEFENGTLTVDEKGLVEYLMEDKRIKDVHLDIARPGEEVRIIPVKDVIEPRVKVSGKGTVFPGFLGKPLTVGEGRTHVLKGMAVVTCGRIVGFQEGIIDMTGPGAEYTPYSKLTNLVVVANPVEGLTQHEHEEAIRLAGLKAASFLAKCVKDKTPEEIKVYETKPLPLALAEYPNLPKVAYVYQLQSQGLLHDTYVYGVDAKKIIPTLIYPTELMDGAIVSGNCVSACDKNTTYVHQNNPVVEELYNRHGKDINFIGIIITNENVTLADKERSSDYTAKLVEFLGLDGVIITEEGFGNPDTDLIMNCRKIEEKGVKTVLITDEYAGRDGASQSLADADPKADAVVTSGNANEVIVLPPMKKIIGLIDTATLIAGGSQKSLRDDGSIEIEIQAITGATSEVGFTKLSAVTY